MFPTEAFNKWFSKQNKLKSYSIATEDYSEPGLVADQLKVEHFVIHVTYISGLVKDLDLYRIYRYPKGYHLWFSAFPGFHNDMNNRMSLDEIFQIYEGKL